MLEPLIPQVVIKFTTNNQEESTMESTNYISNNCDEFDFPKANIEPIKQYYQNNPSCPIDSDNNFAIISGAWTEDTTNSKTLIFNTRNYPILEIIAGETFVIFHTVSGVCYFMGDEEWCPLLGISKEDFHTEMAYPIPFTVKDPVERVVARDKCMFLTKSGTIHWWNGDGIVLDRSKFGNENIVDMAMGDGYAVLLSESGQVYGYGNNTSGQLGIGPFRKVENVKFDISKITERIIKVYASYNTTLLLTNAGSVYSCGESSYGAHGFPVNNMSYERSEFNRIDIPHKIVDIYAGLFFVALKTNLGEYFVFGYNNMAQFGRSNTILERIEGPHYLDTFPQANIGKLSCGSYHSTIVTKDNRVYISGWSIQHPCFPSNETKYHYLDIETILRRKSPLPSNTDLYSHSGLQYLIVYSKSNNTNCFNYKKSYKICDITFKFDVAHVDVPYPTFMGCDDSY